MKIEKHYLIAFFDRYLKHKCRASDLEHTSTFCKSIVVRRIRHHTIEKRDAIAADIRATTMPLHLNCHLIVSTFFVWSNLTCRGTNRLIFSRFPQHLKNMSWQILSIKFSFYETEMQNWKIPQMLGPVELHELSSDPKCLIIIPSTTVQLSAVYSDVANQNHMYWILSLLYQETISTWVLISSLSHVSASYHFVISSSLSTCTYVMDKTRAHHLSVGFMFRKYGRVFSFFNEKLLWSFERHEMSCSAPCRQSRQPLHPGLLGRGMGIWVRVRFYGLQT